VLAPTGTIGLMMDCDTTGIEPDLGLVKLKKMVGGGSIVIVNQTVPQALRHLGYTEEQVEAIVAYIDENKTIHGAPALREEHTKVFQCAMGDDTIHYMGHVKMMAAAQPFISGAISKTVNLPETRRSRRSSSSTSTRGSSASRRSRSTATTARSRSRCRSRRRTTKADAVRPSDGRRDGQRPDPSQAAQDPPVADDLVRRR
jgi:ribonucleotide reductase alpha subunit